MEMNINEYVYVKLTPDGLETYKKYYQRLNMPPYPPKMVGFFKKHAQFELWKLMEIFGPQMIMGSQPQFENNIIRFNPPD